MIGTGRVVDTNMKQINASDILIMISAEDRAEAKLAEIIKGNSDLTGYESTKYLNTYAKYRRKGEKTWTGTLKDYQDGDVTLVIDGDDVTFEKSQIAVVKQHLDF